MAIANRSTGPGYPGVHRHDAVYMSTTLMGNTSFNVVAFTITATIASASCHTAVSVLADSYVGAGRIVHVTNVIARVNGTTAWATTATVKLQDTNGTPVDFVTYAVASMTSQARMFLGGTDVTTENALSLNSGGTAGKGLQLLGDANGTGSNFVVTVTGYISDV